RVFSDLLIKDRMRARVNKRLRDIEAGSEYIMKELRIKEEWKFDYSMGERGSFVIGSRHQLFVDEKKCSIGHIERFCARASIGWLKVEGTFTLPRLPGWARRRTHTHALPRPQDYNYQAYDLIKKFKEIEYLCLRIPHEEHERVRLVDNYLFELAELCKTLNLYRMGSITPNALNQLYKNMIGGSTKLRKFKCIRMERYTCVSFLRLIGITIGQIGDTLTVTGRDVEAFEKMKNEEKIYCIFDGNMEISFTRNYGFRLWKKQSVMW
ncbi:hypothetical protein PMAYCL1PPCAC_00482, partial [Pristionchus mayeri]